MPQGLVLGTPISQYHRQRKVEKLGGRAQESFGEIVSED